MGELVTEGSDKSESNEVKATLVTSSHPESTSQWVLTADAMESVAEQLPGMVVTLDFDPERPVGRVTSASVDEVGIPVTIAVSDPKVKDLLSGSNVQYGPAFSIRQADHDETGRLRVHDAKMYGVGVFRKDPPAKPAD